MISITHLPERLKGEYVVIRPVAEHTAKRVATREDELRAREMFAGRPTGKSEGLSTRKFRDLFKTERTRRIAPCCGAELTVLREGLSECTHCGTPWIMDGHNPVERAIAYLEPSFAIS